jgi:hypothetical protein
VGLERIISAGQEASLLAFLISVVSLQWAMGNGQLGNGTLTNSNIAYLGIVYKTLANILFLILKEFTI